METIDWLYQQIIVEGKTNYYELFEQAKNKEVRYSKEDVLKAGEIGEINHLDTKHIVSLLDEARELNKI